MTNQNELSNPRLDHIIDVLVERRKLWLMPGLAALMLSWVYVYFVRAETYTATQSLIVRDDLLGQSLKPGQFDSLDQMKSAQETILEIARKPQVIRNALKKVGPSNPGWFGVSDNWPDDKTIEEVQGSVGFSAPNGAEFGHTEVIVLSAKGSSRERARDFILALQDEIDAKVRQVRGAQLGSMKDELRIIRDSAKTSLSESSAKLNAIERAVGADLPTLRALSDPQSGEGTMAQTLLQIRAEKRQAENELDSARNQRNTLKAADDNPDVILATSDELFKFQPALNRLKQELIKAQSSLAESIGRYERAHPTVLKHEEQVRSMHRQIHDELDSAERGLESRITLLDQKVQKLGNLEGAIQDTFNSLSSKRVDYQRLDEEVKKKTEVFNEAQSNLAAIQQLDLTDTGVTLLTRVDAPQVSTRADGLGKTTTILGGGLAGFLAGFGLVLLLAPNPEEENAQGSRLANPPTPQPPVAPIPLAPQIDATNAPAPVPAPAPPNVAATPAPASAPVALGLDNAATTAPEVVVTPVAAIAQTSTPAVPPATQSAAAPKRPAVAVNVAIASKEANAAPATPTQTLSRSQQIEEEINKAVARGQAQFPAPAASQRSPEQVPQKPADNQGTTPALSGPSTNDLSKNRGTGDSSGVPTAASILASLDAPAGAGMALGAPVITPQQTRPSQEESVASTDSLASPLPPTEGSADDLTEPQVVIEPVEAFQGANAVEPRRRSDSRPIEIIKQASASKDPDTKPADLEKANDAQQPGLDATPTPELSANHSSNPFLNTDSSSASAADRSASEARAVLAKAKINAALAGTLPPVAPAPTPEDEAETNRQPVSTIPIPDQIRKLTDSISSFAKPISRVTEKPENDF